MSNEQYDAYQVVFNRNGLDIETLYWIGSFEETRRLAGKIACKGGAVFRISSLSIGGLVSFEGPRFGLAEGGFV
jgi:hypothetical protein